MYVSKAAWAAALGVCAALSCAGLSCAAPGGSVELSDSTHRGSGDSSLIPPAKPGSDDSEGGSARETVIGGSVSWERPEVGSISGCTATLVAPEVIITAAHCLGYRSATSPGNYGDFTVWGSGGDRRTFRIDLYTSFSRTLGENDVALMRLADPVPASVATPAKIAPSDPSRGTNMSIWGFGCTRRGSGSDWQKRRYDFLEGSATNNLCPGDSGGPVMTDDGQVVRINSGYYTGGGGDIFGEVPRNHGRLAAQMAEWSDWDPDAGGGGKEPDDIGGGEVDPPAPEPGPERDPCNGYATTCGGCAPIGGCGWCAASATCVSVDDAGDALGACGGGVTTDPSACEPSGDRCGAYGPFPEFTCYQGGGGFVRCRSGAEPEFLVCPGPYRCVPGSRELWCYVW